MMRLEKGMLKTTNAQLRVKLIASDVSQFMTMDYGASRLNAKVDVR
jgi:hypothetical protein